MNTYPNNNNKDTAITQEVHQPTEKNVINTEEEKPSVKEKVKEKVHKVGEKVGLKKQGGSTRKETKTTEFEDNDGNKTYHQENVTHHEQGDYSGSKHQEIHIREPGQPGYVQHSDTYQDSLVQHHGVGLREVRHDEDYNDKHGLTFNDTGVGNNIPGVQNGSGYRDVNLINRDPSGGHHHPDDNVELIQEEKTKHKKHHEGEHHHDVHEEHIKHKKHHEGEHHHDTDLIHEEHVPKHKKHYPVKHGDKSVMKEFTTKEETKRDGTRIIKTMEIIPPGFEDPLRGVTKEKDISGGHDTGLESYDPPLGQHKDNVGSNVGGIQKTEERKTNVGGFHAGETKVHPA